MRKMKINKKRNSKNFAVFLILVYATMFLVIGLNAHATYNADCDDINAQCSNPNSEFCDASFKKCLCRTGDGYALKTSTQKCVQTCGSWGKGEQICLASTNEQPCRDRFGSTTYETNSETECILCCRRPISSGFCGDGIKNGREECDGIDLAGKIKCTDLGLAGGNLRCFSSCTIDRSACSNCGPDQDEICNYDEQSQQDICNCVTRPLRVSHTPNDRNPTTIDTVVITARSNAVVPEISIDVKTSGNFDIKKTCNNVQACEYQWVTPSQGTYEYRARDNRGITSSVGIINVVQPCTTAGQTRCDDGQCRASCGTSTCSNGQTRESDSAFCSRLGKNCNSFTANDNCGTSRTASCGTCPSPQTCGTDNICSAASGSLSANPNSVALKVGQNNQQNYLKISGGTKPYSKDSSGCFINYAIAYCDKVGEFGDLVYIEGRSLGATSAKVKDSAGATIEIPIMVTTCDPATKPTTACAQAGYTYQCVSNAWACASSVGICSPLTPPPCSNNFGGTSSITNSPADYTTEQSRAWRIAQCVQPDNGHATVVDFMSKYNAAWPDAKVSEFSPTTSDKLKFPQNGWVDLVGGNGCWKFEKPDDLCVDNSQCTPTGRCDGKWCTCTINSNCRADQICDPTYKRCGPPGNGLCGNGVIDSGEDCEPGQPDKLNGATCQSLGKGSGTLTCHSSGDDACTFDFEQCTGTTNPNPTTNCNDPTGTKPSARSVTPISAKKNEQIKISGTDLTNSVQFIVGASTTYSVTGSVNPACSETTLNVPSNLNPGKYTLTIRKAQDKISNGLEFTVKGSSTILKYTPNDDASGYCDEDFQCLVNPFGKNGAVECVNSLEYSEDNYCELGAWSTRTKLLVLKLLKLKSGDYTLFCDTKENTLNNLLYQTDSGQSAADAVAKAQANNFCVLKTKDNLIVAASLNAKPEDLAGLANVLGVSSCNTAVNDGFYYSCDPTNKVFYNKKLNTFIYSSNPITLPPVEESSSTLIGIIKNIIDAIKRLIIKPPLDETYVTGIKKFRSLYLAEQNGKSIMGSIDGKSVKNMVIQYNNFDVDICKFVNQFSDAKKPTLSGITCKNEGKNYYVLAQGSASSFNPESIWPDMTSKLRLK